MSRWKKISIAAIAPVLLLIGAVPGQATDSNAFANPATVVHPATVDGQSTTVVVDQTMFSKTDTQFFRVNVSGGSTLTVETKDCCIPGDHWLSTIINPSGDGDVGAKDVVKSKCGSGSTRKFTGSVWLTSSSHALTVLNGYCSGVDVFPGSLTTRFTYDGSMTVTPIGS